MGVIFGLVPRTHPVATFVFKTLIALKGRNALILSCHRAAQGVGQRTGELITDVLARHGAPAYLVQWVQGRGSRETTHQFMRHPSVAFILATGGEGMVRAAYSSGTPAIGVGPGNAPVWVCADADPATVADAVIMSKSFENGIICASENNLVVDNRDGRSPGDCAGSTRCGACSDRTKSIALWRPSSTITCGASCMACRPSGSLPWPSIHREHHIQLIVVPAGAANLDGPLGREKLAPIVSLFAARDENEALALCQQLLDNEGAGHTAIVHTHDVPRTHRTLQL